jgi:hypothetical protein
MVQKEQKCKGIKDFASPLVSCIHEPTPKHFDLSLQADVVENTSRK